MSDKDVSGTDASSENPFDLSPKSNYADMMS